MARHISRPGLAVLGLLVTLLGGQVARGDGPRVINFQGVLADSGGTAQGGMHIIAFRLYPSATGGTACHTSTQNVPVHSGLMNVNIGDPGSISEACQFTQAHYLSVAVNGDAEMTPRLFLGAAAYALAATGLVEGGAVLRAGNGADMIAVSNGVVNSGLNAELLDGKPHAELAKPGHTHTWSKAGVYACSYELCYWGDRQNGDCYVDGQLDPYAEGVGTVLTPGYVQYWECDRGYVLVGYMRSL